MKKFVFFISLFTTLSFASGNLYAKIVVESTKGEAAYKQGSQWAPLTKGLELAEGAKISTGVKSWALINIDGNTVKVEQLTMMKIYKNQLTADTQYTHIGLKHGTLDARVKRIGQLKTSFKITTPVATSSVRGTREIDSYGAKSGQIIYFPEGNGEIENPRGVSNHIQGNSVFRLGSNDPRPENPLSDARDNSLVKISDPNVTGTENQSNEYNGFNTTDPGGSPSDIVPSSQSQKPGTTSVNIQIGW